MTQTQEAKPYHCHRTETQIKIDGRLDEAAWAQAEQCRDLYIAGTDKRAAFGTAARLLWSSTHLYFAAEMEDADIYGLHEGHDPPFGGDDVIELFIKPSRQNSPYWEFHVTAGGATRDYFYARRGAGPDERWMAYDSGMKAAVCLDGTFNNWEDRDRGWSAEVAIPWGAFEKTGGRPKRGDRWTFMVARYDYSVYQEQGLELSATSVLPNASYHLHEYYRDLIFYE